MYVVKVYTVYLSELKKAVEKRFPPDDIKLMAMGQVFKAYSAVGETEHYGQSNIKVSGTGRNMSDQINNILSQSYVFLTLSEANH